MTLTCDQLKEIHIKKLGHRGPIELWQVDGVKIRAEYDEDFTNFGQHYEFPFIPEKEIWLDVEATPDERKYFIDNALVQLSLCRIGEPMRKAWDAGNSLEKSEREKAGVYKKALTKAGTPDMSKIHLKEITKTKDGIVVWLIDGRLVRDLFKVNFVSGGHDRVYDFVPHNEVWIDNDAVKADVPYILLHELFERVKMKNPELTYYQAHRFAREIEWKARHSEEYLKEKLLELGCSELKL